MDFNSQICTTREQSEKLLALGLKKETADMGIYYSELYGVDRFFVNDIFDEKPSFDCDEIPAWSLHRLIEMLALCPYEIYPRDNVFENVIYDIEVGIKEGYFNKDYLI